MLYRNTARTNCKGKSIDQNISLVIENFFLSLIRVFWNKPIKAFLYECWRYVILLINFNINHFTSLHCRKIGRKFSKVLTFIMWNIPAEFEYIIDIFGDLDCRFQTSNHLIKVELGLKNLLVVNQSIRTFLPSYPKFLPKFHYSCLPPNSLSTLFASFKEIWLAVCDSFYHR